ncbi:type VI secretion system baseplate subunit TssE [Motiliproteus sp. MSK22-1]|uniref:type VI secretion system baseplate subunit TssE n=1 Tax=Motiliproteus sp. MSK22-1 TaxID=1897630 RepID=UPI0009762528|nr:type VI secretion system baseplate subunit TssE [Motiliproteus sp. MSK22-1]OMH38678.1 type VI secretion system lysozyme [Motiliproteus sp. MSK22-1]
MAELTHSERLQPALLDRLTDDDPQHKQESRDKSVLSLHQLRRAVLRDMGWLLNTVNFSSVMSLEAYPQVARSVINYGTPDLSGHTASNVDIHGLERLLRQAIIDFEPRFLKHTVKIKLRMSESQMDHNALSFDIEAELWAQPVPLHLYMKTEVDLETGNVSVTDSSGKGFA